MTTHRTRTLLATGVGTVAIGLTAFGGTAQAGPCPEGGYDCVPKYAKGTVNVGAGNTLGVRVHTYNSSFQKRQLRNGARVAIRCQVRGERVSGTYGTSNLWNKLKHGGYVADVWVNTGSDRRVAPWC